MKRYNLLSSGGRNVGILYLVLSTCTFPCLGADHPTGPPSWTADNGNGTYSNPLFYDEFSDPDMIRVGDDYYLTGTTMHTMPGLPILHSRDLVNWKIIGYACDRIDLGPDFRLEDGKEIYGQGIWAPSFRYHHGTFYIFANVNRFGLQVFRAKDPRGPWTHNVINKNLHDLSVLFDDDGKIRVVWGARTINMAELNPELTDIVPGTERVLIPKEQGMGEGSHFYKIKGKYYIVSAVPGAHTPMKCGRADRLDGPWEVTTISEKESLGIGQGYSLQDRGRKGPPYKLIPPNPDPALGLTLHQGGIIDTKSGEWWGYSMQDHNSVGRLTCLSPVTWVDGWPYFGLPNNLTRTPSIWVKPNTGSSPLATSPYERSDDFSGPKLKMVWQWNHLPVDGKWSLSERPGFLRLHASPASDFWWARNTLTQRAIGPESSATVSLDASALKPGDVAGLALLNLPYGWIGLAKDADGLYVQQFDQLKSEPVRQLLRTSHIVLRVHCNFDTEKARFSYSTDGKNFTDLGDEFTTVYQGKTFQGVRYSLFNFDAKGAEGGYADFDSFTVDEPRNRGLTKPIPYKQNVYIKRFLEDAFLTAEGGKLQALRDKAKATPFRVMDRGQGRVALQSPDGTFLSVGKNGKTDQVTLRRGKPGTAETFQWEDLQRGDVMFLSLATNRYLSLTDNGSVTANDPGPQADRKSASSLSWSSSPPR